MMYMAAKHIKQLCRVRLLGKEVRVKGIEVPAKGSRVRAKARGVQVKGTGIDEMAFWRFRGCNVGMAFGGMWIGGKLYQYIYHEVSGNEYETLTYGYVQ